MSLYVHSSNIAEAWVKAYSLLSKQKGQSAVNLSVTIVKPSLEILAVRNAIDLEVANLQAAGRRHFNKSIHTVANTIFPISLYRQGRPDAFYRAALIGQSGRDGKITSWGSNGGTYIGRLLAYPTYGGEKFNQLARMIQNLDRPSRYQDIYEMSLTSEPGDVDPDRPALFSASTFVPSYDNQNRGGQCLSHISLHCSTDGILSMTALYRHQTYLTRAYGNFVGLSRLMHFLVRESRRELQLGELMIVASHAEIDSEARPRSSELAAACASYLGQEPSLAEWEARRFGAGWSDLDLPSVVMR